MKSRPILFSAPMVRALLAGTKTQTRRVSGLHVINAEPYRFEFIGVTSGPGEPHYAFRDKHNGVQTLVRCRNGQPGNQLWVRETFMDLQGTGVEHRPDPYGPLSRYAYQADTPPGSHGDEARKEYGLRWKPSIHMPRAACRITLEITGVRVERLQDISEADAKAEGCERLHDDEPGYVFRGYHDWHVCPKCGGTGLHDALGPNGGVIFDVDCTECDTYVKRYRHLWESINGQKSWDLNPWVWVLDFRRIT